MYYDLNIQHNYKKEDAHHLERSDYKGYCFNYEISKKDINTMDKYTLPLELPTKKVFRRITVKMDNSSNNVKNLINKCDLLCVYITNPTVVIDEKDCDLIAYDLTKPIKFKNINPNVFYEIRVIDALYSKKDRLMWMYNARILLNQTKCRNVVISSGASCGLEIRSSIEMIKLLQVFGLSEDKCKLVLENSIKLLEKCAERRYLSNGCVFNTFKEGTLKEEFIIKRFQA